MTGKQYRFPSTLGSHRNLYDYPKLSTNQHKKSSIALFIIIVIAAGATTLLLTIVSALRNSLMYQILN